MKKLLIFHQALAPYRVDFFNHLAEKFDSELVLFDTNLVNQKFNQKRLVGSLKCKVSYLLGGFRWKDRYFRTGALRKIWRERPDVVLGCEYSLVTIVIALYRFVFKANFRLYTMTDDNVIQFKARTGLKAILRWMFVRMLDGIVVTNEATKHAYEAITPDNSTTKYFVIPILHDEDKIRKDADSIMAAGKKWRSDNLERYEKVAVFVGRLDEVKNVEWLVDIFGELKNIALVMVGNGPLEDALRDKVSKLQCKNVYLVGRKEGREVYEMMAMADVLVLPSVFEPYGAVVGEALQWGTPCIVSDRVGAKDLVGTRNGAVFRCNDAINFASVVNNVVAMKCSCNSLINDSLRNLVLSLAKNMEGNG